MTRWIFIITIATLYGLNCDSTAITDQAPLDEKGEIYTPPVYYDNQIAIRFINESELSYDSIRVWLNPPFGPYFYERFVFPLLSGSGPHCYEVVPRQFKTSSGDTLLYDSFAASAVGGFRTYNLSSHHAKFPSGKFSFYHRLNPYVEHLIRYGSASFNFENFESSAVQFRLFNDSPVGLSDIQIHLPDTTIHVELLDVAGQTNYFSVERAYRYVGMSFWVGTEFLEYVPIDYVGERLIPNGHYNLRLDTFISRRTKISRLSNWMI